MLAYRIVEATRPALLEEVPKPSPKAGEVLIKVASAGACRTDLHVMDWPHEVLQSSRMRPPFTLGHEGAGWVAELGPGATYGLKEGDPVAIYGAWGCGYCRNCRLGAETHCDNAAAVGSMGGGLGRDGAMAEYELVPAVRLLLPLGKLDPATAAPLTDAALSPYHAIRAALPLLVPGSNAVVIGVGGLGHMAIQLLRALTPAHIVAVDTAPNKLELASQVGAHEQLLSGPNTAQQIRDRTRGLGAELVLDFVGSEVTLRLASQTVRAFGRLNILGLAGGRLSCGFGTLPLDAQLSLPYWGTVVELMEVLSLAETNRISLHVERFSLRDAPKAYEKLRAGQITGRAVIDPR